MCVALISIGSSSGKKVGEKAGESSNNYLIYSVISALIAGMVLSINTLSLQYCVRVGCRIDQANYDGNFMMFISLGIKYLSIELSTPGTYSTRDLLAGSGAIISITIGVIALGKGLACGNGGPMQAIENQKTLVATLITAIIR